MDQQGQLNFDTGAPPAGYNQWVAGRKMAAQELARRLGLPLNHQVEVWLHGGIQLKGILRLREEIPFMDEERMRHLELTVDRVPFTYREIESCVRLD
jgi:hypothetical protein